MTLTIILVAAYALSVYLLRKLLIKEDLTDIVGMFLTIIPFVNTLGLLIISGSLLMDKIKGKIDWDVIIKKFFGK